MFEDAIYHLLYERRPFQQFRVHFADGTSFDAPDYGYVYLPPHRLYLHLEGADMRTRRVPLNQIINVEELALDKP